MIWLRLEWVQNALIFAALGLGTYRLKLWIFCPKYCGLPPLRKVLPPTTLSPVRPL